MSFPFQRTDEHFVNRMSSEKAYEQGLSDAHSDIVPGVLAVFLGCILLAIATSMVSWIYKSVRNDIANAFAKASEDEQERRGWTMERASGPQEVVIVDDKTKDKDPAK